MFVKGIELFDLNVGDADVMEKFESELEVMTKKMSSIDIENSTQSQAVRIQCRAIFEFFNAIWGSGTDKKIFGDKTDLTICMDAFEEMVKGVEAAKNALMDKFRLRNAQIAQRGNRQQRRQQQKNKHKTNQHHNGKQYNQPKIVANNNNE